MVIRQTTQSGFIGRLMASLLALLTSGLAVSSPGEGIPIGTNVTVRFANVEVGRDILTRRDDFIAALTPLDRRARRQTDQEVSERDFLEFAGQSVRAWTPDETNRITAVLHAVGNQLARWQSSFPTNVWLVKTSGEEEFNNCYTRQNAIVFPAAEAAGGPAALRYILPHELFHVLSRHDPELRAALYACIGFKPINEIELPEELQGRKVTNPDGVANGWAIGLTNRGEVLQAVPLLLANGPRFNPNDGEAGPSDYFRLLAVKPTGAGWVPQRVAGHARLLRPDETTGWFEQIGRNTAYTIHPDEILADNFVRLIHGDTNVPTPRILLDMANVLRKREARH